MKTITEHIREYMQDDLIAREAMQRGLLNLRAYARDIRSDIEVRRREKVDIATMAVALSRIEKEAQEPLSPAFKIFDMTLQAPLWDLTYSKQDVSVDELQKVSDLLRINTSEFVTITQSFREITIITPARHGEAVQNIIKVEPKFVQTDLFAATIHFSVDYLKVPNVVYSLLASIAARQVNLVEVVSTASELSLIIEKKDVENVTTALQKFL